MADLSVQKAGETWLHLILSRGKLGLEIETKAHPLVEEFFASRASTIQDAADLGRAWFSLDPDGKGLPVYKLREEIDGASDGSYTLGLPGYPMMYEDNVINLSFLRLKGISEGVGVRFGVKSVMSLDRMKKLKVDIGQGMRLFCKDYLVPVKFILTVSSSQE